MIIGRNKKIIILCIIILIIIAICFYILKNKKNKKSIEKFEIFDTSINNLPDEQNNILNLLDETSNEFSRPNSFNFNSSNMPNQESIVNEKPYDVIQTETEVNPLYQSVKLNDKNFFNSLETASSTIEILFSYTKAGEILQTTLHKFLQINENGYLSVYLPSHGSGHVVTSFLPEKKLIYAILNIDIANNIASMVIDNNTITKTDTINLLIEPNNPTEDIFSDENDRIAYEINKTNNLHINGGDSFTGTIYGLKIWNLNEIQYGDNTQLKQRYDDLNKLKISPILTLKLSPILTLNRTTIGPNMNSIFLETSDILYQRPECFIELLFCLAAR